MYTIRLIGVAMAAWICGWAVAAPPASRPEIIYQHHTQAFSKTDYTGEQFCWNNAFGLPDFLEGYKATGDMAYLDWGVKYYDALIGKMTLGPDGYKGFIGPYIYNSRFKHQYWCDVHVGDAILLGGILDFSYTVMRDPKLKEKYGAKALSYAEVAARDVMQKWDVRGTYKEDGPFGVYTSWDKYGQPGQYKDWQPMPADEGDAALTLPFNKSMDMGVVALRLWQITGDQKYKRRAEQIFGYFKSRIQKWHDCYHWNYWEPGGRWDLSTDAEHPFRHWINTHGERNYQEGEVSKILKAYNAGIVFTEEDMRAIINTNLKVMWNGDSQNPKWANSTADLHQQLGKPEAYAVAGTRAGIVWSALAQFDPTERTLLEQHVAGLKPNSGRNDAVKLYFQSVIAKATLGFARQDAAGDVKIPSAYTQIPMGEVRTITMAAVLPSVLTPGAKTVIACKLLEAGDLEVALYSADGKSKLASLRHGREKGGTDGRDGILVLPFDGTNPASGKPLPPGDYRVRWTVAGDGFREFPITIPQPRQ
jgi:hypothetical protein